MTCKAFGITGVKLGGSAGADDDPTTRGLIRTDPVMAIPKFTLPVTGAEPKPRQAGCPRANTYIAALHTRELA